MHRRSTEILHPRIGDIYTPQTESLYREPQKHGLLASRFYESGSKVRPQNLYRDAGKPTTTAHIGQSPGARQRFMQEATQRIEYVFRQYPIDVPSAYDVRKVIGSEKPGIILQVPAPVVEEAQPPCSRLCLHQA